MAQDNLLDRFLNTGSNLRTNLPRTKAIPAKSSLYEFKNTSTEIIRQDNQAAAVDQSLYRFKAPATTGNSRNPLTTPLAQAASKINPPAYVPAPPRSSGACTIVNTYLLTEADERLMTENNDNIIV